MIVPVCLRASGFRKHTVEKIPLLVPLLARVREELIILPAFAEIEIGVRTFVHEKYLLGQPRRSLKQVRSESR